MDRRLPKTWGHKNNRCKIPGNASPGQVECISSLTVVTCGVYTLMAQQVGTAVVLGV